MSAGIHIYEEGTELSIPFIRLLEGYPNNVCVNQPVSVRNQK